jgi:hypothetical protein
MTPGGAKEPSGDQKAAIESSFGSTAKLTEKVNAEQHDPEKLQTFRDKSVDSLYQLDRRLGEIRRRLAPIDRIPPRREIFSALVLIFEIIGVLPHIDAEHHPPYPLFERRILVGRRDDIELAAFIDDEPCPSGAKTS